MKVKKSFFKTRVLFFVFMSICLTGCTTTKSSEKEAAIEQKRKTNARLCPFDYTEGKKTINNEELKQEIENFKYLFTQAYVLYDRNTELGFDLDKCGDEIYAECIKCQKKKNVNSSFDVFVCFLNVLRKNLLIEDSHLRIAWDKYYADAYENYCLFYSDIIFEKKADGYYVIKSTYSDITPGMKYDGNEENLYNFVEDKIICWRYGIMSNVIMETAQIKLEGKEFEVSVKYEPPACYGENALKVLEDDDFLFLGIGTFSFGISGDDEKDKKEEEIFNSFLDKARTAVNKKNVVVDLSGIC